MVNSIVRVDTPASSTDCTTLERVKAELDLDDGANDVLLAGYIAEASAAIARFLGVIARESVTEVFRLTMSQRVLILGRAPLVSITAITEDGIAVDPADYETDDEVGLLYRLSSNDRCMWTARRVSVSYAAGWIMPGQTGANLPADIERAAIAAVSANVASQGRDRSIMLDVVEDVGRTQWFAPSADEPGLPSEAVSILRSRKRWLAH